MNKTSRLRESNIWWMFGSHGRMLFDSLGFTFLLFPVCGMSGFWCRDLGSLAWETRHFVTGQDFNTSVHLM